MDDEYKLAPPEELATPRSSFPQNLDPRLTSGPPAYRDGDWIVMHATRVLPNRCVATGELTSGPGELFTLSFVDPHEHGAHATHYMASQNRNLMRMLFAKL